MMQQLQSGALDMGWIQAAELGSRVPSVAAINAPYLVRSTANVAKLVRHPAAHVRIGLRGADVHAAVHLRGIHADDLDGQPLGQRERERTLARRGRAHQQDGGDQRLTARAGTSGRGPPA